MTDWKQEKVLVMGMRPRGIAMARYLIRQGARVYLSDPGECFGGSQAQTLPDDLSKAEWMPWGAPLQEGAVTWVLKDPSLAWDESWQLADPGIPVMGDLEFGYRESHCLNIAIAGSNGKSSAMGCVQRVLESGQRHVAMAGPEQAPIGSVLEQSGKCDFLTLQIEAEQLVHTSYFRPSVAVLLNLAPHARYEALDFDAYCHQMATLFRNQQAHDWLIIQSEALAKLHSLGVSIPGKVISFSAQNRRADVFMDRGLLISRINGWSGPMFNMADVGLKGDHHAENLMAAMLVGHVLKISIESMKRALVTARPLPGCGVLVRELGSVQYVDDSKCANPLALDRMLRSLRGPNPHEPHVWLIAGGDSSALDYHHLGPLISHRVKGVHLIGSASKDLQAAWSLFAPCQIFADPIQAINAAHAKALPHDVVLLSPACSTSGSFRSAEHLGALFQKVVAQLSPNRAPDAVSLSGSKAVKPMDAEEVS
jgi:UDP-N-acetylmuramoylalanine--D-glutamate ligase